MCVCVCVCQGTCLEGCELFNHPRLLLSHALSHAPTRTRADHSSCVLVLSPSSFCLRPWLCPSLNSPLSVAMREERHSLDYIREESVFCTVKDVKLHIEERQCNTITQGAMQQDRLPGISPKRFPNSRFVIATSFFSFFLARISVTGLDSALNI